MNWQKMQTYGDPPEKAFESLCNQLFENWCKEQYARELVSFRAINGSGGDGGVESCAVLANGSNIALQAKWFLSSVSNGQISQIRNSIKMAMKVRPQIDCYIVCVPRNLSSKTARTENSEESRWTRLVEEIKDCYPDLTVVLWDDFAITKELGKETSAGIKKFWFMHDEISIESVQFALTKSKESWLKTRYIPELNSYGKIHEVISTFLGDLQQKTRLRIVFEKVVQLCDEYNKASNDLLSVLKDSEESAKTILVDTQRKLNTMKECSSYIIGWLKNESGRKLPIDFASFSIDTEDIVDSLKESIESFRLRFLYDEVIRPLRKLSNIKIEQHLMTVLRGSDESSLLFLGEPGTGKTHGMAAEADRIISDGYHIPLLIPARDIPAEYSWMDVIKNSLGMSKEWNENELWQGLSSLAARKKWAHYSTVEELPVIPKVVILVDGIDESSSQEKWKNRIRETAAIVQKYPSIRFGFTSRPYVFSEKIDYAQLIRLGASGDVPVYKLFQPYTQAYSINASGIPWVRYAINTPLSLKLFCELNRGQSLTSYDRADLSIASLLKEKIGKMEIEFAGKFDAGNVQNQYVLKAMRLLTTEFYSKPMVERNQVIEELCSALNSSRDIIEKLLQYIEEYGIIHSFSRSGSSYLSPDVFFYQPGIQGYFDYLSALMLIEKCGNPQNIDFSENKYINQNSLYTLAVISIQSFDYIITSNNSIDSIVSSAFKNELLFWALRHSEPHRAEKYKVRLLESMGESADELMTITNKLILPLSRFCEHPLGSGLLHEFLSGFSYPATRDVLWSVPPYLRDSCDEVWYTSNCLRLNDDEFRLQSDDLATGAPVVLAWALSNLDNSVRETCRKSLMEWALSAPYEFYNLFLHFACVNDPQIRSDIFSILMCLIFEREDRHLVEESAKWLMKNVLSPEKIDKERDIAIRYYSCAIVKKAVYMGVIENEEAISYLPPYNIKRNYIKLNIDALAGTRMGGYSAIDYDLARYVLIDHFNSVFYSCNDSAKGQMEKLMDHIAQEQPEFIGISTEQFFISAAYAFVLNCGWTEDKYYGLFKDANGNRRFGVDIAIRASHHPATHGSKSSVMTICEKYVWQARNMIAGFLADRLLYSTEDEELVRVDDYGLLDDFIVPAQEIGQIDINNLPEDRYWHVPEPDAAIIDGDSLSRDDLIQIVTRSLDLDWEKWVIVENGDSHYKVNSEKLMVLFGFSDFYSPMGVDTCIFTNTLLVASSDLPKFISKIRSDAGLAEKISNPVDWSGKVSAACYITPKEICWFPWKKRHDSWFTKEFPDVKIMSAVDSCTYNFQGIGDVSYYLPSAPLRELIGVTNSNGYLFYGAEKEVLAEYYLAGERWGTSQELLLVDNAKVMKAVEASGYTLVWIMRELRRESGKAQEKFGEFYVEKDRCHIGYFHDEKFILTELLSTIQHSP